MRLQIIILFITGILGLASMPVFAQKVEREYRLAQKEVPSEIIKDIAKRYPNTKRLRFFLDQGEQTSTVEAKFKYKKQIYSVEYNDANAWENEEVTISKNDIKAEANQKLEQYLSKTYKRWKIRRVQWHQGVNNKRYYEIEIRIREDFEWNLHEIKLTKSGEILKDRTILLAPGHLERW